MDFATPFLLLQYKAPMILPQKVKIFVVYMYNVGM